MFTSWYLSVLWGTHALFGTYRLREAGVRMMRILESLDIQLRPSSSDSSRIGNMGEVLVAGPTLISYFTKFIQYHIQCLIWRLTVTSSLFSKGGEWTHSTGGRCFISLFVCPVNGYCPYIHCSRPILQLCTQPAGKVTVYCSTSRPAGQSSE